MWIADGHSKVPLVCVKGLGKCADRFVAAKAPRYCLLEAQGWSGHAIHIEPASCLALAERSMNMEELATVQSIMVHVHHACVRVRGCSSEAETHSFFDIEGVLLPTRRACLVRMHETDESIKIESREVCLLKSRWRLIEAGGQDFWCCQAAWEGKRPMPTFHGWPWVEGCASLN